VLGVVQSPKDKDKEKEKDKLQATRGGHEKKQESQKVSLYTGRDEEIIELFDIM